MQCQHETISFGFTDQRFPPGTHACQIYTDENERHESVLKFLLAGLEANECFSCFSEKVDVAAFKKLLEAEGIPFDKALEAGALSFSGTNSVYYPEGRFYPEKMLNMLKEYHKDSVAKGYRYARVIGEMTPDIEHVEGGDRLLEYESKVTLLLREHPLTAVCQYSAHDFSGATIMDILKVHPFMVVRGSVVHNPFYISPEEFLA